MEQIAIVTRENVRKYLKALHSDAEIHIYYSIRDVPEQINGKPFLAIYLDLDLLNIENCDIPATIRSFSRRGRVVIGSTDPALIPPLNISHHFGVLKKPYDRAEVDSMIADIRQVYCDENEILRFRANRSVVRVRYELIYYIASSGHDIILATRGGAETYRFRFADIEPLLRDERFLKCNRGVIINMQNVASCDGENFTMPDGTAFPIKRKSLKEIRTIYRNYRRNYECRPE